LQFRYRGSRRESAVAQLFSLGHYARMSISTSSRWLFMVTGFYALGCIPAIFVAEHFDWPEWILHTTQLCAVVLCLPASVIFLWFTRGSRFGGQRWLAVVAAVLSSVWLGLIAYLILTLDFSGID
jgi:hypothetical protein